MKILTSNESKEAEEYMKIAAQEAVKSTCRKSQRGAIIVKNNEIIGKGFNKVTIESLCQPCIREDIHDNSKVELCSAVHAEQLAIIGAVNNQMSLNGSRMYHIKVKNGELKTSGNPSCTVCSREILESGIAEFVLWRNEGYCVYSAEELNDLSFRYVLGEK